MNNWKIWFWGFLGYFWSLIDDNPLNADMLLGLGYGFYAMELLLRFLTIACFFMVIREATNGRKISWRVVSLMGLAFVWSFADDFRNLLGLGFLYSGQWGYPTTLVLQSISVVFLLLAVRSAKSFDHVSQVPRS